MVNYLGRKKFNRYYSKRLQLPLQKIFLIPKFLLLTTIKNLFAHAFRQTTIKGQRHSLLLATNGRSLKIMSKESKLIMEVINHILWLNYRHQMCHLPNSLEQQMQSKMKERMKKALKCIIKFLFLLSLFNKDRNHLQSNSSITIMFSTSHQNTKQFLGKIVKDKDKHFSQNLLLVRGLINKTNRSKIFLIQPSFQF